MAQLTHNEFSVADGEGAPFREFEFDTISQGDQYNVKINVPGSGPIVSTLSKESPTASIEDNGARVRPTGTLTLSFDDDGPTVLILFTGTLHTAHSTSLENVCIGAVD